jgi:hypothetical protein
MDIEDSKIVNSLSLNSQHFLSCPQAATAGQQQQQHRQAALKARAAAESIIAPPPPPPPVLSLPEQGPDAAVAADRPLQRRPEAILPGNDEELMSWIESQMKRMAMDGRAASTALDYNYAYEYFPGGFA